MVAPVGVAGVVAIVFTPLLRELAGSREGGSRFPDVVAIVGAVAALITLVLVQRQIDIARRQLVLARREIKLVSSDLAYSRDQSEFTRKQLIELTRRPMLSVSFPDGESVKILPSVRGRLMFSADLIVRNEGDRTARDAYIELLIPWVVLQHDYSDQQLLQREDTEIVRWSCSSAIRQANRRANLS
jgi:hypothetical protein